MPKNASRILFCAFLSLTIFSCSKDEPPTKNDLLTSEPWKVTYIEIKYNTSSYNATGDFLEFCNMDNRISYGKEGSYTVDPGGNDCDGKEGLLTGSWAWDEDESVVVLRAGGSTNRLKVVELTKDRFRYNVGPVPFDSDGNGSFDEDVYLWVTLKHD